METGPQQNIDVPPPAGPVVPPSGQLLAPVWHTVVLVALLLTNSFLTASYMSRAVSHAASSNPHRLRMVQYGATILFELFLLFLVWIGLRLKRTKVRELIGGKWNTPEDFLLEIAIATIFWVVSAAVLVFLGYCLGLADPSQMNDIKERIGGLMPQTGAETALWVCLSVTAGFVEEIIFRGYLQRQIGALAKNIYVGLVLSAIVFGAGHGYEGTRRMVLIAVYGMMFGLLALWRKSLRPGMMAHAWQDSFAGIVFRFIAK
jgi:membrane protease YdiL (CAAX protease family)